MFLQPQIWEKIMRRWSKLDKTPERDLVIAIIAGALSDRVTGDVETGWFSVGEKEKWFASDTFHAYCRLCGLDGDFIRDMAQRANGYEPEGLCHA